MKSQMMPICGLLFCFVLSSCQSINKHATGPHYDVISTEKGIASWYSVRTNRGTATASGRPLRDHEATAAHKKLPFGTKVRVTNLRTGQSAIVTITDRGPFTRGRIIDVTTSVAKQIGFYSRGLTPCTVDVLELRDAHWTSRPVRARDRNRRGQ